LISNGEIVAVTTWPSTGNVFLLCGPSCGVMIDDQTWRTYSPEERTRFAAPDSSIRAPPDLVEAHDEWQATDRRYLSEATMAVFTSPPTKEKVATPELMTA
jgi:hypothetical protein